MSKQWSIVPVAGLSVIVSLGVVTPAQAGAALSEGAVGAVANGVAQTDPRLQIRSFRTTDEGNAVRARVTWNDEVTAGLRERIRLFVRVVAKPPQSAQRPVVLYRLSRIISDDGLLRLHVTLGPRKAERLRLIGKTVLSVSLQVPSPKGMRTYATTARLGLSSGKDCTPGPDKNLSDCRMVFWNLRNADMRRSILANANLNGVAASGAQFQDADLYQVTMRTWAGLPQARFDRANLGFADLTGANLSGAQLDSANLTYTNFSSAFMRGADLQGAKLHKTNFFGANLEGANFRGATRGPGVDFRNAALQHAVWFDGHVCTSPRRGQCD